MTTDTTQIEYKLIEIASEISAIENTLSMTADGTNWTVADSLSNIAYELTELNKTMQAIQGILESRM